MTLVNLPSVATLLAEPAGHSTRACLRTLAGCASCRVCAALNYRTIALVRWALGEDLADGRPEATSEQGGGNARWRRRRGAARGARAEVIRAQQVFEKAPPR